MKFSLHLNGATTPLILEYDIDPTKAVHTGEIVGLSDGTVVSADEADAILGIAAEEHTGVHDELNARADGNRIRVCVSPDAVYETSLMYFEATGGTATTLQTTSVGLSASVKSGRAVLVSKVVGSTNTDRVGDSRRIGAVSVSGGTATVTLSSGGVPCAGDMYMFVPDAGDELALDATGKGVCFYRAGNTTKFVCVYTSDDRGVVGVKLKTPLFA